MSNNPLDHSTDPFASLAKDANNCKTPESAGKKRRPTNALRPKPLPPIVMPSLFDTIGVEI